MEYEIVVDEEDLEEARRDPVVCAFLEAADLYLERLELEGRGGLAPLAEGPS